MFLLLFLFLAHSWPPHHHHHFPSTPAHEQVHATLIGLHPADYICAYSRWEENNHIKPGVWEERVRKRGKERKEGGEERERKPPLQPDCRYMASPPMRDTGSNSISPLRCWIVEKEQRQIVRERERGGCVEGDGERVEKGRRGGEGEQVVQSVESYISSPRLLERIHLIQVSHWPVFSRRWIMHHFENSHIHSNLGCRPDQVWHPCCCVFMSHDSVKAEKFGLTV